MMFRKIPSFLLKFLCFLSLFVFYDRPFDSIYTYLFVPASFLFLFLCERRDVLKTQWLLISIILLFVGKFIPNLSIEEQSRVLLNTDNTAISPKNFILNADSMPFFMTADGYIQGFKDRRCVNNIDIRNLTSSLKVSWANKVCYNFYPPDGKFQREFIPFVVKYKINKSMIGMTLKLRGLFFIDKPFDKKNFNIFYKDTEFYIDKGLVGTSIYGFGGDFPKDEFKEDASEINLLMKLEKSTKWKTFEFLKILLSGLSYLFLLSGLFFFRIEKKNLLSMSLFFSWQTALLYNEWNHLKHGFYCKGGLDGFYHGGNAFEMLEAWAEKNWLLAIQSPEPVFYFMPGLRYLRFLELLVVGDSHTLYFSLVCFLPVIYWRFLSSFLQEKKALILTILMYFCALNFIGISFKVHVRAMTYMYGEGISYALLTLGLFLLSQKIKTASNGLIVSFLFAISITLRPNLLPFVGVVWVFYIFTNVFSPLSFFHKLLSSSGFSFLLLITLHNIFFGHQWVLLTASSTTCDNMPIGIQDYYFLLKNLLLGRNLQLNHKSFAHHLDAYYPHYLCSQLICLYYVFKIKRIEPLSIFSISSFVGLTTHLFYKVDIRYVQPYLLISWILLFDLFQRRKENKRLRHGYTEATQRDLFEVTASK